MVNNGITVKKSNIVLYDYGLCTEKKPQDKDILWFSEKTLSHGIALDCGSGHGYYLSSLKCERIGLDISTQQLSKTRSVDDQIQLIRADVEHLPFHNRSINYILSFGLLHHLPDQDKGIDEMSRILKKGGYFFVMDSNLEGLGPIYPIWRLTLIIYNLRGRFAEGVFPKLSYIEQYLKRKGFSLDVKTEHSFLFNLSGLLDLYVSYLPYCVRNFIVPFTRLLLKTDRHVSKLLPYGRRLSIKIIAKFGN